MAASSVDQWACEMAGPKAAEMVGLKGASKVAYWVVERVGHLDDKLADK